MFMSMRATPRQRGSFPSFDAIFRPPSVAFPLSPPSVGRCGEKFEDYCVQEDLASILAPADTPGSDVSHLRQRQAASRRRAHLLTAS